MSTRYIPAAEANKIIRRALKEAFPGTKFSVRKTAGSATDINWTDGPNEAQVRAVAERFAGDYFDASTDYRGGFVCRMNGEEVSFGTGLMFFNREQTNTRALERICARWGYTVEQFEQFDIDMTTRWHISKAWTKFSEVMAPEPSPTAESVERTRAF